MNLANIRTRLGQSLVVVVGIGGVVAVLISLFAMAAGFNAAVTATGKTDRALILRAGSESEINGNIPLAEFAITSEKPGIKHMAGNPLITRETYVTARLPDKETEVLSSFPMRGVTAASFDVRDEVTLVKGVRPTEGKLELIAGIDVANRFPGFEVGNTIRIRGDDWQVTGHFESGGTSSESEVWVDERLLAAIHNRGNTFSSMLVTLESPDDLAAFSQAVADDKRLNLRVIRESDFYADQAGNTTGLISLTGLIVGSIMSIGAVFAALNTMYAAISMRVKEIATLKALGFSDFSIFFSVLLEAELLALAGGSLAGVFAYITLNGTSATSQSGTFTSLGFEFMVTPDLLITGVGIALALGFVGGAIPALSAIRMNLVDGLKQV